jgi:hypothetical protein
MARRKDTLAALRYIHRRFFVGQPERLAELEQASASAEDARKVYLPQRPHPRPFRDVTQRVGALW